MNSMNIKRIEIQTNDSRPMGVSVDVEDAVRAHTFNAGSPWQYGTALLEEPLTEGFYAPGLEYRTFQVVTKDGAEVHVKIVFEEMEIKQVENQERRIKEKQCAQ